MRAAKFSATFPGIGLLVALSGALPVCAHASPTGPAGDTGYLVLRERRAGCGARRWCELGILKPRPPARDESGLGIRLDAAVGYWRGRGTPTENGVVWDGSVTPVFRWTFEKPATPRLFVEGGLGVHLLSHTRINNDRIFSTAFQFGEQIGVGVSWFGQKNEYELVLYGQHVSNANIKLPNWGLTYPALLFRAALP